MFFNKLWNFDLYHKSRFRIGSFVFSLLVIVIAIGYPVVEVLFAVGNAASTFNVFTYIETVKSGNTFHFTYENFEAVFPHVWITIASLCVIIRITSIVHSYILSKKELGDLQFKKVFFSGLGAFIIGTASGIVVLLIIGAVAYAFGIVESWDGNIISYSVKGLEQFIHAQVPMLFNIQSYWLALVLTIFLKGLPGYFGHWLSHKTRFFWLVTHRSHHAMEYLYPTATAPAFNFEYLLQLPSAFVGMIVSQLIYTQPLVMEMILWSTVAYSFEVFNHSIAHYKFCYKNPLVRNASRLFGDLGVYHLIHHSAYPQDHTINLGGTPFNFWDRVFGTYRKPYSETPPVGLTNQPPISHNPMRITFSGIAQLIYEWKMNKDFITRLKIIFGDIWYKPPLTKDFLVIKNEVVPGYN
jgi:sterol desaturase/sphingolipid hydroxylase (fatty acid hydroxylase superfamily)